MRCPFCNSPDTQVKDSRSSDDDTSIRRRRICGKCGSRFTTFERVELRELFVRKKDGDVVPFDRAKLMQSITVAVKKRNVSEEQVNLIVNGIQRQLETLGEGTISSAIIGETVMERLLTLDKIAYIRYASVYKNFKNPKDFEKFVDNLKKDRK